LSRAQAMIDRTSSICAFSAKMALFATMMNVFSGCLPTPPASVSLPAPKLLTTARVGTGGTITVVRPTDNRHDTALIGKWVVSSTTHQNVYTESDVAVWVGDAVVAALEQSDYRVERTDSVDAAPTQFAITISIVDALAEFHPSSFSTAVGEARVVAKFAIYKRGAIVITRTFSGVYTSEARPPSEKSYQEALDHALAAMLQQALRTLGHILSREGGG
jgi:hypothetical protein